MYGSTMEIETPVIPRTALRLVRLQRGGELDALFMEAMTRVFKWSKVFEGNPHALVREVMGLYEQRSPLVAVWLAVEPTTDGGYTIKGHALGQVLAYEGRYVAWVNQVVMDEPAGLILKDTFLDAVDDWVRQINLVNQASGTKINEVMMVTQRETRAWLRHAGFHLYRSIYRKGVE